MLLHRFLQIPDRRATATNNQELPKTCRNLESEIALLILAVSRNASSNNERMHQNAELQKWGAAVLAPHGAFGSAAPLRGAGRSERIVRLLPVLVRLQKPPVATALPADPCAHSPRGRPKPPTLSILSRLFAVRKLIKNQTPQKPSQNLKSRAPDRSNLDFVLTFGINFGMDFHEILDFFIIC